VSHLTDGELELLLQKVSPPWRIMLERLCAELRELREQAGERERMAAEEHDT
jgi:hypothetical protein